MTRMRRFAAGAGVLLVLLLGAAPVAAGEGGDYGACVAHHATMDGGFTGDHNPGMHHGIAGWPGCPPEAV